MTPNEGSTNAVSLSECIVSSKEMNCLSYLTLTEVSPNHQSVKAQKKPHFSEKKYGTFSMKCFLP